MTCMATRAEQTSGPSSPMSATRAVDCSKGTVTPRPDFRDHDLLVPTILEELKK